MAVDTYALCPCGSGKKIKFCKCKDSLADLDRVLTMVNGGQVVPALDRLSAILEEHPDAAWALAIRGRLFLGLREFDSLLENAKRFIRLQPSNAFALTQMSAGKLFSGDLNGATMSMLEALTESGKNIDTLILDVSSALAHFQLDSGAFLTARVYASLVFLAEGYENREAATGILRELDGSRQINQLLKWVCSPIERPSDVSWGERYDEAIRLLRSNQVVLAETKLESLQRSFGGQPAILSGLLTCAIWRADLAAQSEHLAGLAACETLGFEQRCRFLARSVLVEPGTPQIGISSTEFSAEIEDVEEAEMAFAAHERFVALPSEMLANFRQSMDEIAPRAGFQLVDREVPGSESAPGIDAIPEALAYVMVFGRETDASARIVVHEVLADDVDIVRTTLAEVLPKMEFSIASAPAAPLAYFAKPPIALVRFKLTEPEFQATQKELLSKRIPERLGSVRLPLLENQSLAETAGREDLLLERTALIRIIENYGEVVEHVPATISKLYEIAGLEPLSTVFPNDEEVEEIANEDLGLVDPKHLSDDSLLFVLQRAQQVADVVALRRLAGAILDRELPAEKVSLKLMARMILANISVTVSDALEHLELAKTLAAEHGLSVKEILLAEVRLRAHARDLEGLTSLVQTLSRDFANDAEVMTELHEILVRSGLIRPDGGAPGQPTGPAAAPPQSGGIWTPDGDSPAPTKPAAGNPAGDQNEGGSKLWVPGMD